ncbi:hypothetical protein GCM10012278_22600 [Nonomuraea glycinis]|uniref:Uncharacterized protein n=1 Tax=Nonomuraea glycinis TaxID=2047744 RepID=A0A918A3Q4_9ACTN|nr:hypothetical protein [Nonomuraea glycinis]GGP04988.1 hypothetical protein GCM10012278_22600 [Nonomuraea glycinis]
MKIVLSLPYALTSLFVVVAERIPFDVTAVPWRVGASHRRAAIRAIGSPALLVTHHPTPWRPGWTSLTPAERRLPRRSGQHLVISTTAAPHELPGSLQLARATARALAREYDGLLIDPLSSTAVPACERAEGEPVDFDLGDNWLSWSIHSQDTLPYPPPPPWANTPPQSTDTSEPAWNPQGLQPRRDSRGLGSDPDPRGLGLDLDPRGLGSDLDPRGLGLDLDSRGLGRDRDSQGPEPGWGPRAAEPDAWDGLSVTSRGLRRFALPEITLDGAACTHRECATGLLRLVAHRLVADQLAFVTAHPDARQRTIDDHLRIEPSPPGDHDPTPFTVRLTPCETGSPEPGRPGVTTRLKVAPADGTDQTTCLKVAPPPDFPDGLNDWLPETSRASLASIDCHPSPALAA